MGLKPYLIDVPVKIAIWIRPDCQRKQFEVIKQARPSRLFLVSDGGRNEEEWKAIYQNRKMYDEEVDWDCKIEKIYNDKNLGLYATGQKAGKIIWNKIEYGIFLEDDIIPSVSYFRYCAELLEKYKNDERIESISGMNYLGIYEEATSDYFFSKFSGGWGIATWKRVIKNRCDFSEYGEDPYIMKMLKNNTKGNKWIWNSLVGYAAHGIHEGHIAGSEFYTEFDMYAQSRLQIVPRINLIKCIGATNDAAHSDSIDTIPKGLRRVFDMKVYEMEFPIRHPKFVIDDQIYGKKRNRIMGHNMPLIQFYRRMERIFLLISHKRYAYMIKKIKALGKKRIET